MEKKSNAYEIYQLKDSSNPMLFWSFDEVTTHGPISKNDYKLIYLGEEDTAFTLDEIYERFNIDRPKDFYGHSLSVSDVIAICEDGNFHAYYVDRFGFIEIPDFFVQIQAKDPKRDIQM